MIRDVDLVAAIDTDRVEGVLDALTGDDLHVKVGCATEAVAGGGSFNVIHPDSGGKVDVFVSPQSDDFTRSRLARRVRADVFGIPTWVATPEDVVLAELRRRLTPRAGCRASPCRIRRSSGCWRRCHWW